MSTRASLIAIAALAACGGGGEPADVPVDAGRLDAGTALYCNPVKQVNCDAGERCAWLHGDGEALLHPVCVEAPGAIALGQACEAVPGEVDDCVASATCRFGICSENCMGEIGECPDSMCDYDVGVCAPPCEVLAPSCPDGTACYGYPWGEEVAGDRGGCVPAGDLLIGASCYGDRYGCGPGAGCEELADIDLFVCRAYCDPAAPDCVDDEPCVPGPAGAAWGFCGGATSD
jgi:hypothetical protein